MDNNYFKLLADILWKAQGRVDAETGEAIHIGDEVQRLRNICDRLRVDSETLKHFTEQSQPVPEGWKPLEIAPAETSVMLRIATGEGCIERVGIYSRGKWHAAFWTGYDWTSVVVEPDGWFSLAPAPKARGE